MLEPARHEHTERGDAAEKRRRQEPSLERDRLAGLGRLPGGEGEQKHRAGPEGVEHRALGVAAGRVQVEEDAVGEGDHAERRAGDDPGPARHTGRDHEDEDHDREQDEVGDRVGEVDDHRRGTAVGRAEDDLEDDRGADGGRGEGGDAAVEPYAPVEARDPRADEQRDCRVAARIEGEVERVAGRDRGWIAAVDEVEADVADREGEDADPECRPRRALDGRGDHPQEAAGGGKHLEPVADPAVGEVVEAAAAEADREMGDEERVADERDRRPDADGGGSRPRQRRRCDGQLHRQAHRRLAAHPLRGASDTRPDGQRRPVARR